MALKQLVSVVFSACTREDCLQIDVAYIQIRPSTHYTVADLGLFCGHQVFVQPHESLHGKISNFTCMFTVHSQNTR